MDTTLLEQIGLTKSEIAVYFALLDIGSSSTGKIVEEAKIASSKVYEVLDRLMEKGLVSVVSKNNVKHFEAAPPRRVMDYMQQQEQELQQKKDQLKNFLPQLEAKQLAAKHKSEAKIFKGIKGGETAFRILLDNMQDGDEWVASIVNFKNRHYYNVLSKIHEERVARKLRSRLIIAEAMKQEGHYIDRSNAYTKIKYVSQQQPVIVNVAGDIVLLNIMDDDITVFLIESKKVADSFRSQFNELWDQQAQILYGLDAIQHVFEEMLKAGHCDYIAARGYFIDHRKEFIDTDWLPRAKKQGFTMRNIVDKEVEGHPITQFEFAQTKYTLPKEFANLSVFWIYGDKVAISNWTGTEPMVIIIDNKAIHDVYATQFELLWNKEKF